VSRTCWAARAGRVAACRRRRGRPGVGRGHVSLVAEFAMRHSDSLRSRASGRRA
jgi:hypothetical protein